MKGKFLILFMGQIEITKSRPSQVESPFNLFQVLLKIRGYDAGYDEAKKIFREGTKDEVKRRFLQKKKGGSQD